MLIEYCNAYYSSSQLESRFGPYVCAGESVRASSVFSFLGGAGVCSCAWRCVQRGTGGREGSWSRVMQWHSDSRLQSPCTLTPDPAAFSAPVSSQRSPAQADSEGTLDRRSQPSIHPSIYGLLRPSSRAAPQITGNGMMPFRNANKGLNQVESEWVLGECLFCTVQCCSDGNAAYLSANSTAVIRSL